MSEDIDSSNTNRLRWTIIENAVTDNIYKDEYASSISNSASSGTSYYTVPRVTQHIESHAILLKRLLKPMYHHAANVFDQVNETTSRLEQWPPIVDRKIFIDMNDRTMWIAIEDPQPIDDFYNMLVSNELANGKYFGYVIDNKPSTNMVPLIELKMSFVEWWCA